MSAIIPLSVEFAKFTDVWYVSSNYADHKKRFRANHPLRHVNSPKTLEPLW